MMPTTTQTTTTKLSFESAGQLPPGSLVDFLNTLPSPLVAVLVGLAPYISNVRHTIQVLSWKTTWEESWLTVALWWATCMFADFSLRYVYGYFWS